MKIDILSHKEFVQRAFQRPPPNLIFISNADYPYEVERSQEAVHKITNKLLLFFDDVELEKPGTQAPRKHHLQESLNFAQNMDELVVTCRIGQSRSAAVAFAIMARQSGIQQTFELLNHARHSPNSLIIAHAQELLDLPHLTEAMNAWKNDDHRQFNYSLTAHQEALRQRHETRQKFKPQ